MSPDRIYVTGNTVVDALSCALQLQNPPDHPALKELEPNKGRMVLVTAHRRENWDLPLENICGAFQDLVQKFPDLSIVYPVHLNPMVRRTVLNNLKGVPRVHLIEPVDYLTMIHLMKKSCLILTDSGGIQEEAPSLGKPLLVMRETTERPEACEAGAAIVVGTERKRIVEEATRLLGDESYYQRMSKIRNPFGDGLASERIVRILMQIAGGKEGAFSCFRDGRKDS